MPIYATFPLLIILVGLLSAFIEVVRDVTERDKHLRELEKWHRVTVDREMKMVEMKKQIQELEQNM